MPIVQGNIRAEGAIIDITVAVPRSVERLLHDHGIAVPEPVVVRALIDTGASISGISPWVFEQLSLESHERIELYTASTPHDQPHFCNQYDVSISIIANGACHYFDDDIAVAGMHVFSPRMGHEALIGRDLLSACNFNYYGIDNKFPQSIVNVGSALLQPKF